MQSFIAVAAHELRNPISAIVGAAETLDHGWDRLAEDDRRRLVEVLVRQSRRLSHLVGELLELSRLDAGRADVAPGPSTSPPKSAGRPSRPAWPTWSSRAHPA